MAKRTEVVYTRRSIRVLPTNSLDRPFHYEAVLVVAGTEALLTALDCVELGEMLVEIGRSKGPTND